MITVSQAETLISKYVQLAPVVSLSIEHAATEVLREDLSADRPLPPFDRVAMDGIAIAWQSWSKGQTAFKIEGIQKAGDAPQKLVDQSACLEVMTGAVLPIGCDTVIRYEDLEITQVEAILEPGLKLEKGQNVHHQGSDYPEGQKLLVAGELMLPVHWAVAASIGKAEVQVSQRPKIAVISTGDELVEVDQRPLEHQIRMSNSHLIQSALKQQGFSEVQRFHLVDDKQILSEKLAEILSQYSVLVLSGGVSMGKYDFIPEVFADLKVKEIFHKIAQRPGKPIWFGVGPESQWVFGLPGNPVSTSLCLYRYVMPALWQMLGCRDWPRRRFAILQSELVFKKDLTYFLPVKIETDASGQILATPVAMNGSGDFASLALSDGFLELPPHQEHFIKGEVFPLCAWKA